MPRKTNYARQRSFLSVYARNGNIGLAAQAAGITRQTHYDWLEDPEYRQQFDLARQEAVDVLHAEAHRRGVLGWEEPQVYQGAYCYTQDTRGRRTGQVVVRKYDPNLLMFLMRAADPATYRDTWKGEIKHSGAISRGPDLSRLTDEELANLERIARSAIPAAEAVVESGVDRSGEDETAT